MAGPPEGKGWKKDDFKGEGPESVAVTITDTRTLVDHADAVGTWVSPVAGESITLFTSDPDPVEATGCLGIAVSTQTSELLFPISAADLSDVLIYVWVLANGTMDTEANGGIALVLLDVTPDEIGYHLAGSDIAAFRHNEGPVGWQCLLLDGAIKDATPGSNTALAGTEAGLAFTAITGIGAMFKTLSKALGGTENCFIDTIRYGNDGLVIAGGTTGARGNFDEIAIEDRSAADGTAYGICHEVATGSFGLQGPLTFGLAVSDAEHWFQDTNVVVTFEDRNIGTARYFFDLAANSTDVGHFQLGLISGSEFGTDGCAIIVPAGIGGSMDFSDADFDFVGLYDSDFVGFDGGVLFCDDATNGITHDVFGCAFTLCGTINPGRVDMKNCDINASSAATAMLIEDSDNTLMEKLNFVSDGTGHALEVTHTGAGPHALTLKGHTYSGYAGTDGSTGNEVLLYNPGTSSADITITIAGGGETPTVMLAGGVTGVVTIVNNIDLTFINLRDNTEVRVYTAGTTTELAGIENATVGSPDDREVTFSLTGGISVDVRFAHGTAADGQQYLVPDRNSILGLTWPNVDSELLITQIVDRSFNNP